MKILFYKSGKRSPIEKYIDALPAQDKAKFLEVIDEIENFGFSAARVVFKPIEGKLWEIKFRTANSGYRILYVLVEAELMIWLHTFSKKTNKTPEKEKLLARKRLKEILK